MALNPGTRLGPYEIVAAAGAGGMGEVYRARDTRLGRDVAVKVLPPEVASDAERLRRFETEARAVAALEHANILGIHDIGAHNGTPYLVTEFLEGETLGERLQHGVLGAHRAVEYGLQVAHGLAAAHQKGVVHRDLKPENIFLTRDGRVKILDFGLAKLESKAAAAAGSSAHDAVTLAPGDSQMTSPGMVLGTAAYMSPEQVRGLPVDTRSDIFSFGAVLYEMLTGRRAFQRESGIETMTAILKEDPPELGSSASGVAAPPGLERIVRRCLEKQPEQRFQSASDLAFALSALSGSGTSVGVAAPAIAARRWVPLLAAPVLLAVVLAALLVWPRGQAGGAAARPMFFSIPMTAESMHFVVSRDGQQLAFVAMDEKTGRNLLFVQEVGGRTAREVVGTEGAAYPFWSPDGTQLGFFAGGYLKKVRLAGGLPQNLARTPMGRGGAWSSKGVIVYSPFGTGPLWQVNEDGSGAAVLSQIRMRGEDTTHRWPVFLPDGERFLFFAGNFDFGPENQVNGIYEARLGDAEMRLVVRANSSVGYAASGHIFYVDGKRRLVMQRFGVERAEPVAVVEQVALLPQTLWGGFSVAENGTVVYNTNTQQSQSQLTWVDRSGKVLGTVGEVGNPANPSLSPDGSLLAADMVDLNTNNADIWIYGLGQGTVRRFTFESSEDTVAVWSPDGRQIAYLSNDGILVKSTSGMEKSRVLKRVQGVRDLSPSSWSPDGKQFVLTVEDAESGATQMQLLTVGEAEAQTLMSSRSTMKNVQVAPNGKWMAYMSDESGQMEIYVATFPEPAGKWQVSRGGGMEPRWRGDSREIYYIALNGDLTAVTVSEEAGFSSGAPVRLFPLLGRPHVSGTDLFTYDASRDGRRFIVNRYVKAQAASPLHIVLHATAGGAR